MQISAELMRFGCVDACAAETMHDLISAESFYHALIDGVISLVGSGRVVELYDRTVVRVVRVLK